MRRFRSSLHRLVVVLFVAFLLPACGNDPGGGPIGGSGDGSHSGDRPEGQADASDGVKVGSQTLPDGLESLGIVEVLDVHDGDTMDILTASGREETIRFYGVDTPESQQEFGQEAKAYARALLNGGDVEVLITGEVTYGRQVGFIIAGDVVVNAALLEGGYAWYYAQYCDYPLCEAWDALEDAAIDAGLGLWAADAPQAPWDWRQEH